MTIETNADALLAMYDGSVNTNESKPEVIKVKDGEWAKILKDKDIKHVGMIGGRDGADYEIVYKDHSSKLFKFA